MALPLVYLSIRGLGAGVEFWDLLFRIRTLQILLRSALLVAAVTGASVAIAVPLAWLTTRTDLPMRADLGNSHFAASGDSKLHWRISGCGRLRAQGNAPAGA